MIRFFSAIFGQHLYEFLFKRAKKIKTTFILLRTRSFYHVTVDLHIVIKYKPNESIKQILGKLHSRVYSGVV